MNDHEAFEILPALAATGQLTASERDDFDDHCLHCSACSDRLRELMSIGLQLRLDKALQGTLAAMPAGSLERFRARAIREGMAPRSAPARPSLCYAMAMGAAIFVVVAGMVFVPHGRKAADALTTITAESMPRRQTGSAPVTERRHILRHSRVIATHSERSGRIHHEDTGVEDANLPPQRFPQVIAANYPFFGPEGAKKPQAIGYPALSRSQISRIDFFRSLNDIDSGSGGGMKTARPVDIASAGNSFDFAAHIRQLHFQLSIAQ